MRLYLQFLLMNFVQVQEITMPEKVRYITQLIEDYCTKVLATLFWGQLG